jgi:hypothetical protein
MALKLFNGVDSFGVLDFAYEILALQEYLDTKQNNVFYYIRNYGLK